MLDLFNQLVKWPNPYGLSSQTIQLKIQIRFRASGGGERPGIKRAICCIAKPKGRVSLGEHHLPGALSTR